MFMLCRNNQIFRFEARLAGNNCYWYLHILERLMASLDEFMTPYYRSFLISTEEIGKPYLTFNGEEEQEPNLLYTPPRIQYYHSMWDLGVRLIAPPLRSHILHHTTPQLFTRQHYAQLSYRVKTLCGLLRDADNQFSYQFISIQVLGKPSPKI